MIKTLIRKIDNAFFGQSIQRFRYQSWLAKQVSEIELGLDYKFTIYHKKNNNFIAELCDKYGSDKGEIRDSGHPYPQISHTYADLYSQLFSHCRYKVKKVFECGLGTNNANLVSNMSASGKPGASLRVWRDYFPNAIIYGADIDREILFEEERIKTYYIDQLNPSAISEFWDKTAEKDFDFMVDDGLHTFEAGSCLFKHSINMLALDGIYIIEDVTITDLLKYKDFFNSSNYIVDYATMYRPKIHLGDNNLVIIRRKI